MAGLLLIYIINNGCPNNITCKIAVLTVQIKFDPVFITVAVAEDEEPLRDLTNSVHINALKKNTRRKDNTLEIMTI